MREGDEIRLAVGIHVGRGADLAVPAEEARDPRHGRRAAGEGDDVGGVVAVDVGDGARLVRLAKDGTATLAEGPRNEGAPLQRPTQ
jgi:hypothetical protein